jgi:hypothetical protein
MAAKHVIVQFKFSSSYPSGGEAWDPGPILGDPVFVVLPIAKSGYVFEWDGAAKKIKAYRQNGTTGPLAEPVGVDLSSVPGTIDVLILNRAS